MSEGKKGLLSGIRHTFSMQFWAWKFVKPWGFRFFASAAAALFEPAWQSLTMAFLLRMAGIHTGR
jgi:hypothetical protein